MTDIYSPTSWRLFDELDVSLVPQGPEQLMDVADNYVAPSSRVLDVGCRDARHLIALAERFGASGVGIDPVPWHIERATTAIAQAGMTERLTARLDSIEQFQGEGEVFDLVWCRDVLEVLPDLDRAVRQMAGVMDKQSVLMAYTTILDGPPDDRETELIHQPLGNVVENLVETNLLETFDRHRLAVVERIVIGTQWREFMEERDHVVSRDLLRLARLRRTRERVIGDYGEPTYRLFEASTQWTAQQFLGRFIPMIYVLRRATG